MQQGSSGTALLTDEQILGMDDGVAVPTAVSPAGASPASGGGAADFHQDVAESPNGSAPSIAQPPVSPAGEARAGEPRAAEDRGTSVGQGTQDEPAWVKALETQPAAAAEARQWRAAAQDVAAIDAAYFSADPGARTGLASRLYENDPSAFRAMLAESARVLGSRDPQALAELARQLGAPEPAVQSAGAKSVSQAARPGVTPENAARDTASFPAEAYRAFEAGANGEVAQRMNEAIDRTLRATLPEGMPEGARRRIGDDIFREIHSSLSSDRELSRQVAEALRDWRFDGAAKQQVVALVSGRARAVMPEVARRVVAEWTSSVLASDRAKTARIDAAASRRDVTGGRLPEPVSSGTLRPRDIDYHRTSDEQILEM